MRTHTQCICNIVCIYALLLFVCNACSCMRVFTILFRISAGVVAFTTSTTNEISISPPLSRTNTHTHICVFSMRACKSDRASVVIVVGAAAIAAERRADERQVKLKHPCTSTNAHARSSLVGTKIWRCCPERISAYPYSINVYSIRTTKR